VGKVIRVANIKLWRESESGVGQFAMSPLTAMAARLRNRTKALF
jgi:hypothetical protein